MMYKCKIGKLICLSLLSVCSCSVDGPKKGEFQKPDNSYYPMPFWHMNGHLTREEIKTQLDKAYQESGFGGVAILPVSPRPNWQNSSIIVPGTTPKFLSEEYFDRYKDILEISKEAGKEVIMYDDEDFPSGIAGGQMRQLYPESLRKKLDKQEVITTAGKRAVLTVPQGTLMAAVAMDTATLERINLTADVKEGVLEWTPQSGVWRVMLFTCVNDGDGVVDFMDPEAIDKFIGLTYAKYADHLTPYFGNVIKRVFIDDVGYVFHAWGWTPKLNEKFKEINGFEPELYYPALWYDIGRETASARVAFHNTRAELLGEGFPKKISEWCVEHNLDLTGHPPANYEACPDAHFDIFKFYRHMQQPLMDMIHGYTYGRPGYNLISSASDYYGRNITAAEAYGNFREKFDKTLMYRAIMELFTRGVNRVIPHGMWYSYHPDSVTILPLISGYNADIADDLKPYSDYVARCSYMLQQGYRASDVAVIYPIKALQGWYPFRVHGSMLGDRISPEIDYYRLSDVFTRQIRRDFVFVHPDFLATDDYDVTGGVLQRIIPGKETTTFKVIVMPGGKVMSAETLKKLKSFYEQGGKILATTQLPYMSSEIGRDAEVQALVKDIFGVDALEATSDSQIKENEQGGRALFIAVPEDKALHSAFDRLGVQADVRFPHVGRIESGRGELSYLHRKSGETDIYFIANSSDDKIDTPIELRGTLTPSVWNPYTGKTERIEHFEHVNVNGEDYTRVQLNLEPVQSTIIVCKK